eukprot:CAMPEP_0171865796 /NCGR_PEP_ID=MMETSP0992-20121227/29811_1 /TAXON_ID=483369 /ORGANISM="non described non described, Strain CCMP2098" /LENGTH=54 /DNA_ID=CAMNT_0012488917 /DNA_START=182 /DNA_END=343 /DNA_ORIENTATION=-
MSEFTVALYLQLEPVLFVIIRWLCRVGVLGEWGGDNAVNHDESSLSDRRVDTGF